MFSGTGTPLPQRNSDADSEHEASNSFIKVPIDVTACTILIILIHTIGTTYKKQKSSEEIHF